METDAELMEGLKLAGTGLGFATFLVLICLLVPLITA